MTGYSIWTSTLVYLPAAFGAALITAGCPWSRWLVAALAVGGGLVTGSLYTYCSHRRWWPARMHPFHQLVLRAIDMGSLEQSRTPLGIMEYIRTETGVEPSLGDLYIALERLEREGFLTSERRLGGYQRGWHPYRVYSFNPPHTLESILLGRPIKEQE